jgi:hypothetical protein
VWSAVGQRGVGVLDRAVSDTARVAMQPDDGKRGKPLSPDSARAHKPRWGARASLQHPGRCSMKYMHKAIWQPDGNLVIRGNSRALLFRALQDVRTELEQRPAGDDQLVRTLNALQDVLGDYDGPLPNALELLGDPVKDRVSRNLLKC